MPNWKKVIVSGSQAHLVAVTASSQIAINPVAASTEAGLVVGPGPAGGAGEGGQIALQPAAGFTSGSFIDMYQSGAEPFIRILRGSAASSDALVMQLNTHTKQLFLPAYTGTTSFTGTVAGILGFTSAGAIVTTTASSAGGSTFPYTGTAGVTGSISATGPIYSQANGQMYFRGGDDAEFWDINVANTVGIYGQQDATIASIKLGSGGGIISGKSGNIGINNTNPTQGTLDVVGNIYATSFTGSLSGNVAGTSSWASNVVGGIGVTSVGTSGTVSGITLTGGTITSTGTITLGGSISGLTNSNLSGTAGITNANLANSSITIAGTSVSLGGSIAQSTILASSGVFSGSSQIPNGSIANAQLANSSVTVGSTAISLGSSATTIAGLSSVTSTTFVGALTGNASTATTATTATNATNVSITGDSSGTAFTLPLITGTTGTGQTLYVDSTPAVLYTPSTNQLWASNLQATGSLFGTASWASNVVGGVGVTSVGTSGTVSGITLTGGTITSTGTITLGGSISGLTTSNLSGTAGITNAQLANSSVTIGSTAISLGGTSTTLAGLTNVTSTSFTGSLFGTASWASNALSAGMATYATQIKINDASSTAATFYPVFTNAVGSAQDLSVDTATLTWNPSTNTLTAENFAGTSSVATNVVTERNNTNATFYPTFVDSHNATPGPEKVYTAGGITFNPSTNAVSASSFTGSLFGTASWATNATTATSATSATSATTAGSVTNAVTFNNGGAGDASGTTYNGSAARTISYNTVGAPSTGGTGATGTWGIGISGNAATATTAASASSILASTVTGIVPIPFMSQKTPGVASYLGGDTILTYNTSTGTLNATTFNGALSGNATTATTAATASTISITATDAVNTTYYPVFVDGQTGARISRTDSGFTFNSLTNALTLSAGSITVNTVNATTVNATASYASQSGYTMQFVLATTGSNPAGNATYRMGAAVRDQLQATSGRTRIYVPRPGKVRYAHIYVRTNGALASAGTSTFFVNRNSSVAEQIGTSTSAGSSADATVSSTALSMSVALGDFLEINWTTPAWGTLPTAVEANGIIYIENNA